MADAEISGDVGTHLSGQQAEYNQEENYSDMPDHLHPCVTNCKWHQQQHDHNRGNGNNCLANFSIYDFSFADSSESILSRLSAEAFRKRYLIILASAALAVTGAKYELPYIR